MVVSQIQAPTADVSQAAPGVAVIFDGGAAVGAARYGTAANGPAGRAGIPLDDVRPLAISQTIYPNPFLGYAPAQTFGARVLAEGRGAWLYLTCVACDSADVGIRCSRCMVVRCNRCYVGHRHDELGVSRTAGDGG